MHRSRPVAVDLVCRSNLGTADKNEPNNRCIDRPGEMMRVTFSSLMCSWEAAEETRWSPIFERLKRLRRKSASSFVELVRDVSTSPISCISENKVRSSPVASSSSSVTEWREGVGDRSEREKFLELTIFFLCRIRKAFRRFRRVTMRIQTFPDSKWTLADYVDMFHTSTIASNHFLLPRWMSELTHPAGDDKRRPAYRKLQCWIASLDAFNCSIGNP